MTKKRIRDSQTNEKVLKEFRHRCAFPHCDSKAAPQIHHIDGDPSNNDLFNLIPLCPNDHLDGQHRSHDPIEPFRLRLFRIHKHPSILAYEFRPLYKRVVFLNEVKDRSELDYCRERVTELINFIKSLEKGDYYAQKIRGLLNIDNMAFFAFVDRYGNSSVATAKSEEEHWNHLLSVKDEVHELIAELSIYQGWDSFG